MILRSLLSLVLSLLICLGSYTSTGQIIPSPRTIVYSGDSLRVDAIFAPQMTETLK